MQEISSGTKKRRIAPGPKGKFLLGNYKQMRDSHLDLFLHSFHEYGDIVRFSMGPEVVHLVVHPHDIDYVLRQRSQNFPKSKFNRRLHCAFGTGILTARGDHWRRQRRMIQPAFSSDQVVPFSEIVVSETERSVDRWLRGNGTERPVDLAFEARLLNLEIVGRSMFGTSLTEDALELDRAFEQILRICTRRIAAPLPIPTFIPTSDNRKLNKAISFIDQIISRIITERRKRNEDYGDLLSMLISATDPETGEKMTDTEIRDEVITMFLAGYDSPGTTMAWIWWELARHHEVFEILRGELDSTLGGRPPTIGDLESMPYTMMVVKEGLRLAAPAGNLGREAKEDDIIGGFHIPASTTVVVNSWVTHRHPDIWPNPERFNPQRFARSMDSTRPQCAFIPFGEGPRKCIGVNFGLMQLPLILATVCQRVRFRKPPERFELEQMMTYRAKAPIWAHLEKR